MQELSAFFFGIASVFYATSAAGWLNSGYAGTFVLQATLSLALGYSCCYLLTTPNLF